MIAGLCGGAARYTNLDPTLMRLLVVVAAFVTGGAMVPAYLIAWLIVPEGDPPVQP
jgi:phage shock protein C